MEIALFSDPASIATSQNLGFQIRSNHHQISVTIAPIPQVRSDSNTTNTTRTLRRRKRRTKRRSLSGDDGSVGDWLFGGEVPIFGGGDGGGSFGGGGGKGWNFGGFGDQNWDSDSSSSSPADPAFDFVYEVISWIVLSNCVHFAFKKVLRAVAGDSGRGKVVPIRLTSVC